MENFSLERENLYDNENVKDAENEYEEKRDRVLDNIIAKGNEEQSAEEKENYRERLREKIKEGFIDREYLSRYNWQEKSPLIVNEIVDFLIPQIKSFKQEEKIMPNMKHIEDVILPTKNGRELQTGSWEGVNKKIIPRFEMLVDFLEKNNISTSEYFCITWKNREDMQRKESYVMFVLPSLGKMVFVCDEEGNATYVIHDGPTEKEFEKLKKDENIKDGENILSFYYQMTKNDLQILEKKFGLASQIRWNEDKWLNVVEDELAEESGKNFTIKEIKEELIQIELAPDGWLTNQGLAKSLKESNKTMKKSDKTIKKAADKYQETNPEWFKIYLDVLDRPRVHYSPELIKEIEKKLTRYESAPDGWLTNKGLAKLLKKYDEATKKEAYKYKKTNPEWFKVYLNTAGNPSMHYSPELIKIIKKKLKNNYE